MSLAPAANSLSSEVLKKIQKKKKRLSISKRETFCYGK
jgi:hypothetical protein